MKKVFIVIAIIIAAVAIIRFSGPEDSWICTDGLCVKHGNPSGPAPTADFSETGHFVIDNPGMDPGIWYLVYEEPGAPALYAKLSFDGRSECIFNGKSGECPDVLLLSSALTDVRGIRQADGSILVTKAVSGSISQ